MDDPFETDAPKVVPPPKKRSLFSSKAIGKSAGPDEGLFFRAKEVHPQILAEEERKRQKKILKLERKRSSTSADVKELTPPEEKRRRVAAQAKDQDGYSSDESRSPYVEPSSRTRRYCYLRCVIQHRHELTFGTGCLPIHRQAVNVHGKAQVHITLIVLQPRFQHGTAKR